MTHFRMEQLTQTSLQQLAQSPWENSQRVPASSTFSLNAVGSSSASSAPARSITSAATPIFDWSIKPALASARTQSGYVKPIEVVFNVDSADGTNHIEK